MTTTAQESYRARQAALKEAYDNVAAGKLENRRLGNLKVEAYGAYRALYDQERAAVEAFWDNVRILEQLQEEEDQ